MNLPSYRRPSKRLATDLVLMLAVASTGVLGTVAIDNNLRATEASRIQEQRNVLAEAVRGALGHAATSTFEAVRGTALMMGMQPDINRAQFALYVQQIQLVHPDVVAMQWQKQDPKHGYIYPGDRTEWIYMAQADLAQAQAHAHQSPMPVATAPFRTRLSVEQGPKTTIVITTPVYRQLDADQPIGFINALVDIAALSAPAAQQARSASNDLILQDRSSPIPGPLFSTLGEREHEAGHGQDDAHDALADTPLELNFGLRTWDLLLHPSKTLPESGWVYQGKWVLSLGLLLTLLFTVLLARSQFNRRRTERTISHERMLRDELLAEKVRLNEVVESTGVAIWEYDIAKRLLTISERWHKICGYTREELGDNLLKTMMVMLHPEDRPRLTAIFANLENLQGERFEYEHRLRRKDGQWMWVKSMAHVVQRNAQGVPIKVAGINLEVTRQKEAEIRIHALNASLEAQMQEAMTRSEARATLGTLIASVSHEMATPIGNSMMTASTLTAQAKQFEQHLVEGSLKRSELAQFVSQVQSGNELLLRNLERAVALLKNFRQVAADQASEQRRSFDLQQSLREILDTLEPSLRRESHRVVLEVPKGIGMDSYPGPLGQVLINLINNAYLHAFDGVEHGEVHISATANEKHVTLVCTDNGCGIAPDTLEKMFQPFFSTRIGRGGTGLGMSIVENLVKATLGGTLEVQSTVGQGTTVTIRLPRTAPEPRQEEEDA
nr:ATP-binding protein [uncultured Rhodoferax sp.]